MEEDKFDVSPQPLSFLKILGPNQRAMLDKLELVGGALKLFDS